MSIPILSAVFFPPLSSIFITAMSFISVVSLANTGLSEISEGNTCSTLSSGTQAWPNRHRSLVLSSLVEQVWRYCTCLRWLRRWPRLVYISIPLHLMDHHDLVRQDVKTKPYSRDWAVCL